MNRTGYRPLQQNFPINTPVAPVRPFLWRPPSSTNLLNTNIQLSFPVMANGPGSSSSANNLPASTITRLAGLGNDIQSNWSSIGGSGVRPTSSSDPFLNTFLTTLRNSLTAADIATSNATSALSSTIYQAQAANNSIVATTSPAVATEALPSTFNHDMANILFPKRDFLSAKPTNYSNNSSNSASRPMSQCTARMTAPPATLDYITLDDSEDESVG